MSESFKTPKGTELFYLNLKGKKYLQVADRLIWFREEHPNFRIWTTLVEYNEKFAIVRAEIADHEGHILQTAHQQEHVAHFQDAIAKGETAAVGRALAMLGYGTQFAQELEMNNGVEERLVDSPRSPKPPKTESKPIPAKGGVTLPNSVQMKQPDLISDKGPVSPPLVQPSATTSDLDPVDNDHMVALKKLMADFKISVKDVQHICVYQFKTTDPRALNFGQYKELMEIIKSKAVP